MVKGTLKMRINKLLFSLLVAFSAHALANNEVYIEQIGDSSTINITQDSSDNKVGTATVSAFIGGGSNTVTIDQIGSTNDLQFLINGASTDLTVNVLGNTNSQSIICGSLNTASCSGSTITQTITGDNNTTTVSLGSGANHTSVMSITGDTNTVTHTSTSTGTVSATITVFGNTNNIGVTQSGTLTNTVSVNTTGNNNVVNINQSN